MNNKRKAVLAALIAVLLVGTGAALLIPKSVQGQNNALLTGTIKSASGEKLAGVTVSAKAVGQTITTSVYTDEEGAYYFPPMAPGKYDVWAQADTFETSRAMNDVDGVKHQDFTLKNLKDFARQLTGDQMLASMPEDTPEHTRMKDVVLHNCTSCHQPNYILQNRFDQAGWTAILNLMAKVNVGGMFQGADTPEWPIIAYHKTELAAFLAEMRGPGPTAMKFKLRPRPTGDAARVVITEYAIPLGTTGEYVTNDGSDWSLGTPSKLNGVVGVHDSQPDFNGNIWFAYNAPSKGRTVGKIDPNTGIVTDYMVEGRRGTPASAHGITRDQKGILWFNASAGGDEEGAPGRLARIDPNTGKIDSFSPPKGMQGVAGTLDVDGKGQIWATTNTGALRFDPETKTFKEFKSSATANADGLTTTYGLAADREGNGWWAEMNNDLVGKSDIETGKSIEVKLPPHVAASDRVLTPDEKKMYALGGSDWNSAKPWAQAPRRLAADKNGDDVWVCDWYGGNLARIDIHTLKVKIYPVPTPSAEPYAAVVDSNHNVWVNLMNADMVVKFDPKTEHWTEYSLPTLGTELRHVSILEQNGTTQVYVPYERLSKEARLTFRTKEDLQALKNQVQQTQRAQAQ